MNRKFKSAKRIISVLVALLMTLALVPAASAAATVVTVNIWDTSVFAETISSYVAIGNGSANMHVIAMVTEANAAADYKNALALGYGTTTQKTITTGAYVGTWYGTDLTVKLPDSVKTGTYKMTVGTSNMRSAAEVTFSYVGYEDRQRLLGSINGEGATAQGVVSALNAMPLIFDVTGSNSKYYTSLPAEQKLNFAQYILDNKGEDDVDLMSFGTLEREAFVVVYSNISYKNTEADKKLANLALQNVYLDYYELFAESGDKVDLSTDARYQSMRDGVTFFAVLNAQGDNSTIELIGSHLNDALDVQCVNEAGWLVRPEKAEEYVGDVYVEDLEIFLANDDTKIIFCKALDKEFPVYTKNAVIKAFADAYDDSLDEMTDKLNEDEDDDSKTSTTSKKSSGGGGGGGGGGTTSYTVDQALVRSDPLNKKKLISDYYNDMTGYEWAEGAVLALTESGIVNGTGEMKFEPARTLKREEFMKLLVNTFNLADMKATSSFTDVADTSAWYYVYIASAEKAGITTGRGDGTFGLGDYVTREEMATLVYRAALKSGVKLGAAKTVLYSDVDSLSDYAVEAVCALTASGVMNGSDGKFSPKEGASRAQAAVVINNIKSAYLNN